MDTLPERLMRMDCDGCSATLEALGFVARENQQYRDWKHPDGTSIKVKDLQKGDGDCVKCAEVRKVYEATVVNIGQHQIRNPITDHYIIGVIGDERFKIGDLCSTAGRKHKWDVADAFKDIMRAEYIEYEPGKWIRTQALERVLVVEPAEGRRMLRQATRVKRGVAWSNAPEIKG